MLSAQTHYHCAFDISRRDGLALDAGDVIKAIRSWITQREGKDETLGKFWFFYQGRWEKPNNKKVHIHIRSDGKYGGNPFTLWTLRYEHPDGELAHRFWITDITLERRTEAILRFVLHVYYRINSYFIGDDPELPTPTTPGIVIDILSSRFWKSTIGCVELSSMPVPIDIGVGKELADIILSSDRLLPIVVISKTIDEGSILLNPRDLAKRLAGNAMIYFMNDTAVAEEIQYFLNADLRCNNGTVRVYLPKVRTNGSDYKRHRYFVKDKILQQGSNVIMNQIITGLARRGHFWIGKCYSGMETVLTQFSINKVAEQKAKLSDPAAKELFETQEQIYQLAVNEKMQAEKEKQQVEERAESLEYMIEEEKDKCSKLEFQLNELKKQLEEIKSINKCLVVRGEQMDTLSTLPETIEDMMKCIAKFHSDKVVFTKEAYKTASDYSFPDKNDIWKSLWGIAVYIPQLFSSNLNSQEIEQQFKINTGFELSLTEGKMTKQDKDIMKLRKFTFEGKEYLMVPHVKLRRNSIHYRIYFDFDKERRMVIINHCGEHLDNYSTKKRK